MFLVFDCVNDCKNTSQWIWRRSSVRSANETLSISWKSRKQKYQMIIRKPREKETLLENSSEEMALHSTATSDSLNEFSATLENESASDIIVSENSQEEAHSADTIKPTLSIINNQHLTNEYPRRRHLHSVVMTPTCAALGSNYPRSTNSKSLISNSNASTDMKISKAQTSEKEHSQGLPEGDQSNLESKSQSEIPIKGKGTKLIGIFWAIFNLLASIPSTVREFFVDSKYFLKGCTLPNAHGKSSSMNLLMKEFKMTFGVIFKGFLIVGCLSFVIELVHIPLNEILVYMLFNLN